MSKRLKTDYPGVFYREADRIGGKGKEKVFYVIYKKDGKTIEAKAGRQFQRDMTASRANQYRTALIEGRDATPQERRQAEQAAKEAEACRWTIAKLWDSYYETFAENKALESEQRKFDRYLRDDIGQKEPKELRPLDVDRLRINLQKQGKRTTAARVLELLRRTLNYGCKKALIPPIQFKIEIPRLNNQVTEDLNPEQLKALLTALEADIDQMAANMMRLALFTGMRRGEILKLRWQDIDWSRGLIHIVDPKGGKDQIIPLNDTARAIFESIQMTEGNPYVFPGRIKGEHLTECRKSLTRIAAAAGFPKGFRPLHGLRHVFASMLASSGQVNMYTLQKLMTHKSPLMTQRYAHLRDECLRRASDLAGDIITETMTAKGTGAGQGDADQLGEGNA